MYSVTVTTGERLASMPLDVLRRLDLPLSALRSQTYYGTAHTSGRYCGAQALIRQKQPVAV